ncbi:hypothetical protein CLU81_2515 [Flavobacterium sp. 9]|uniref:FEKKY domain-containing protein n=1 Tax=Flavobacterium sp. 9 TaxID=2035198 RepID=UPI000C193305|nr:hypothetical protein [Flavobacterium sp. 9]PIF32003.1 hypothetical protein CLU81_2515 [Flavobacterium sp. 9]
MKKGILIALIALWSCKSEDSSLLVEFKNKAYHDIKVDNVKLFGFGLPLPPRDSLELLENNKRINIRKKYGLVIKNLGCTVDDKELDSAVSEYYKITNIYLEERNGKGWKEKMEKELNSIILN